MVNIKINNIDLQVEEGTTVLNAALKNDTYIPHFCYHPSLSIAGNCRMCLVEVKGAPKLLTACSTMVQEGMEVFTDSDVVKEARKGVLEFILLDHPVDCPICDKSGECVLQDYHFDYGTDKCRNEFPKERNQVEKISEKIYLNPNRCVLCTRCVRFLEEVTETCELTTVDRGSHTKIACVNSNGLDKNPFASNISDICPVGALGLNEFRFRKRVWFAEKINGICQGCEAGCNVSIDLHKRDVPLDPNLGPVLRFSTRPNEEMDRYFICDEGRLSYKNYNIENRTLTPILNREVITEDEGAKLFNEKINGAKKGIVVLSPLASVEENYALYSFAKNKGFEIYRAGTYKKELPEVSLFIDKTKASNRKLFDYLKVPRIVEAEGIEADIMIMLHGIGKPNDKSAIKLIGLLKRIEFSVIFEQSVSDLGESANLVLPVPTFVEEDGCYINGSLRLQYSEKGMEPPLGVKPAWKWINDISDSNSEKWLKEFSENHLNKKYDYVDIGEKGVQL